MAHYQLSYGFNSNDNNITTANGNKIITTKETKTTETQSLDSTQESRINVADGQSSDKSEVEKRKLPPQSSEPGENST